VLEKNPILEILYISYDGMTDPLGESQVLPYLGGLSVKGHKIHLISFEKKQRFLNDESRIRCIIEKLNIEWIPLSYTAHPPVISTLWDIFQLSKKVNTLIKNTKIEIVHCRSYIAAIIGLSQKRKKKIPFVFDMRGFWADERVDGKIWNLKNPLFRWVYQYFKKKEKQFFIESDHIISLTRAGKEEILKMNLPGVSDEKITVIPCCTDFNLFCPATDLKQKENTRKELEIPVNSTIISYLGSFGTWYMAEEMLDFFKCLLTKFPDAIFLLISRDDPAKIMDLVISKNINPSSVKIRTATRQEVPALLAISDATLFFIKPVFSKKASSPTKMGEALGMGIPVICNDGIGDCTEIINKCQAGFIIKSFDNVSYKEAVENFENIRMTDATTIRILASEYFDLNKGISHYHDIYISMAARNG
jgi:glycosyltransferase involved in cell wall biosynthesis